MTRRCPEMEQVLKTRLHEGQIEYIRYQTEAVTSKSEGCTRHKKMYIIPYKMEDGGMNDFREMGTVVKALGEKMVGQNESMVEIAALGELSRD